MKRNDWILATAVLLAAGVLGAYLLLGRQTGSYVMISKDNEEIGTYSLKDDRVIDVGEGNRLEIKDGAVHMLYADCPDQICVNHLAISRDGESIICLPNKVVIAIEAGDTRNEIDSISR